METNFLDCAVSAIRKVQKVFDCGRIHSVGCGVIRIRGFSKSVRVGDQICLIAKGALGEVLEVNEIEAIATLNVSLTGVTVGMVIENHGAFVYAGCSENSSPSPKEKVRNTLFVAEFLYESDPMLTFFD